MFPETLYQPITIFNTERLYLRPLSEGDIQALFDLYCQPEVAEYSDAEPLNSLDEAEELLADFNDSFSRRTQIRWGIVVRATNTLIGTCAVFDFDEDNRRLEIGYELHSAYWGQGFMAEALRPVLAYGFKVLDLHRIEAVVTPENIRSTQLLMKLGFRHEGTLRERFFFRGRFWDDAFYGLLRSDFNSGIA
ncbi:MAG: GNAT family N-acetyltransferase [bacterium]|nr:GNAT family N-acetyltransferase [bacterium]